MQLSVKTPVELTVPFLEKCALVGYHYPSAFAGDCVFQCMQYMDNPHGEFQPLYMVEKFYYALGREEEIHLGQKKERASVVTRLLLEDRRKRAAEAKQRLEECRKELKKKRPKHVPLKISSGSSDVPNQIKGKIPWLQITPNAFVIRCLRDCMEAMDDPKKAFLPPPVVVDFWTASHARLRPKAKDGLEAMVMRSQATRLRERSIPILDTIVRLAQNERWDVDLKTILQEAGVLPKDEKSPN